MLLLENEEITTRQKDDAQGDLSKYVRCDPVGYFHYQGFRYTTAEDVIAQGSCEGRALKRGYRS